jgi:hypothetical protein
MMLWLPQRKKVNEKGRTHPENQVFLLGIIPVAS